MVWLRFRNEGVGRFALRYVKQTVIEDQENAEAFCETCEMYTEHTLDQIEEWDRSGLRRV